jgi:phosphatidylserine synthase
MDAIDGKQARRTGTSGPLGELFDHGCDAINMMVKQKNNNYIFIYSYCS